MSGMPRCGERGLVAGAEALAVGALVLLAGMALMVNAWAVVDTRMALDSAAREYLRTYTEADSRNEAAAAATSAATGVLGRRVATTAIEDLTETFGPCAPARVRMTSEVPVMHIPFLDAGWGVHTVTVDAAELIDAHREMVADAGHDRLATACHG